MFRFKKLKDMVTDIDDTLFVQAKALYQIEKRLTAVEKSLKSEAKPVIKTMVTKPKKKVK